MQRLIDALTYVTEDQPQFAAIANGFGLHLAKSGMPDEVLAEQLVWVKGMIDHIIGDALTDDVTPDALPALEAPSETVETGSPVTE